MDKNSIDSKGVVEKAITRFAKDVENKELSAQEILVATSIKKALPSERLFPKHFVDAPISSQETLNYIKEAKLRINLAASRSELLRDEINSATSNFWSSLDDVQNELKSLESDIKEEEIKAEDKFQEVHYNAFARPIDMAERSIANQIDLKTGLPFLSNQRLTVNPGVGLTLPRLQEERLFIREIILLDEGTDVGDTPRPIISTDPNYLTDPDLSFRHVIARRAYDETGKLYNYTESTCKLLIRFGHTQLINCLNVRPLSHAPLFVKSLEYINELGEVSSLELENLSLDGNLNLIFEPVRTDSLVLTLVQYAPVDVNEIFTGDLRKRRINKALEGADWSCLLNDTGEYMHARIYDFSLESLSAHLYTYNQLGHFTSQKIRVEKPLSFSLSGETEAISVSSAQRAFGTSDFLPEGVVVYETYTKVVLEDDLKRKQTELTIPIPNSKTEQVEMLPLIGGVAKTLFVPDLFYPTYRLKVKSAYYLGDYVFVTCEKEHGFAEDETFTDRLEIYTGREYPESNIVSTEWTAYSSVGIAMKRSDGIIGFGEITENYTPKAWVIRYLEADPLAVYKEGAELVLGTDYVYSLDSGTTWYDRVLTYAEFSELKETLFAGCFRIKMLDPDYDLYYWCQYRRANKQWLHPSKLFLLKKSSVLTSPKIRGFKGSLQTVVVMRASSRIPYLSSIIRNYKLKVREL